VAFLTSCQILFPARKQLSFSYDYMGRRMQKVVSTWNGSDYANPVTTRFVYLSQSNSEKEAQWSGTGLWKKLGKNLVLLAALVTTSCDGSKYSQLPQERCRSSLPITVPSEEIVGCQSLSREVRGGVMVAVRLTLSTNTDQRRLSAQFTNASIITQARDRSQLIEMVRTRATSLLGGTQMVPIWFNPPAESAYAYLRHNGPSGDWEIIWDQGNNIYALGISEHGFPGR
jgi:hypothetical protein